MKLRIASLTILCLALAAIPAWAQNQFTTTVQSTALPTPGPSTSAMSSVTPSKATAYGPVTGFLFGVWEFPGDALSSVDWSITAGENSGTTIGSGTASGRNLTDQFISTNQYGYNIDRIQVSNLNVYVNGGTTYWLNLQNAAVPSGDPVYWDENSGAGCRSNGCPSSASESAVGTIPGEAFTINGFFYGTPEPSGVLLLGIVGLAGLVRRRLL